MRVAVAFMLASAVVQATQCSSGDKCPSNGEPQNGVSMLQTQMNLNQGNTPYVLSDLGAAECPSGFQTITDCDKCDLAGQALIEEQRGIDHPPSIPTAPKGCISHENTMYYFNTAPVGQAHQDYSMICEVSR